VSKDKPSCTAPQPHGCGLDGHEAGSGQQTVTGKLVGREGMDGCMISSYVHVCVAQKACSRAAMPLAAKSSKEHRVCPRWSVVEQAPWVGEKFGTVSSTGRLLFRWSLETRRRVMYGRVGQQCLGRRQLYKKVTRGERHRAHCTPCADELCGSPMLGR
jgi:hypothetical protein